MDYAYDQETEKKIKAQEWNEEPWIIITMKEEQRKVLFSMPERSKEN
jgi:hypothetical protein